jgi:hypothetical protein
MSIFHLHQKHLFLERKLFMIYIHNMYIYRQKMHDNHCENICSKILLKISSIKQCLIKRYSLVRQLLGKKYLETGSCSEPQVQALSIKEEG